MNPVTIYDVARAAGVAPSTVSRTFSRPGRVNAETAERIRQVAAELGYRARPLSRAQAGTPTRLLGLLITDIGNPFHAALSRGAQRAASEADFEIVLVDSRESAVRERAALERLVPVVDGFIIGVSRLSDTGLRTIAKQRPTVVLNRELQGVPSIVTDNAGGMASALDHLASLGHEAVTYVAGPEASWADGVRFRSFYDHGSALGLTTRRMGPYLPTFDGGVQAARDLLDRTPTAVVAYNDLVAAGIIHGLTAHGVHVPDDVSVVGFDDILAARLVMPPLTSVSSPLREMGRVAVSTVIAMIGGAQPSLAEAMLLPSQLRVRASTGRRRR